MYVLDNIQKFSLHNIPKICWKEMNLPGPRQKDKIAI